MSETPSSADPKPTPAGLWADVKASIRGVSQDYTSIPLGRAVLLLAIPMVLEMSMQSLFAVVDVYFVGRLGSNPVAILGLGDSLLSVVFAVAMGLSMGTAAMVARRVGEGDSEGASVAATQAIGLGFVCALPFAALGILFPSEALQLMGATPELAAEGAGFIAILIGGNVTVVLLFLINAVFRGAGDPARSMRALWLANGINIALDPILIFGWGPIPAFGLEGAAIATTVGRALGVVYQLRQLSAGAGRHPEGGRTERWVRIELRHWLPQPAIMARLARVSGVGILQFLVSTASFLGLVRILAAFGDEALAGYTVAIRIIIFILLPAWGIGNAAATLVGQNLGAGNPARAERAVWLTAFCNMVFLGAVAVIFFLFAEPLAGLFTTQAAVAGLAAECLRIISYSYVFWGYGMITVLAFNGAGDTTTPTWINFFVYWVVQIPLAYALAQPLGFGPQGVFIAVAACQILLAVVGVVIFRRGRWKSRTI